MKDTHESLATIRSNSQVECEGTYTEDDPNERTCEQNLDRKSDIRDAEHAPVQAQDGNFGEEQTVGVEKLGDEEQ